MKLYFYCFVSFVCCACAHKEIMPAILDSFPETVELSDGTVLIEDYLFEPYRIQVSDSLLFAYSSSCGEDQILVTVLPTLKDITFLKIGRGPGEATHVNGLQILGDSLFVSVDPKMIYSYSISNILDGKFQPNAAYHDINGFFVGTDLVFCEERNLKDKKNSTMYQLRDLQGETSFFGDFVESDTEFPEHDYTKQTAYQGKMYVSPDCSKAIFVYLYAIGYDIIDIPSLTVEHHVWKAPQVTVRYISELDANIVKGSPERETGFSEGCATENNIYLKYISDNQTYILKYDWKGKESTLYKVNLEITRFFVDEQEASIYALVPEDDRLSLIRYNLREL